MWVIFIPLLVISVALGILWANGIEQTKDWNLDEDYECFFGDKDNE